MTADHAGFLLSTLVIVGAPILLVLAWRKLPLPVWRTTIGVGLAFMFSAQSIMGTATMGAAASMI